MNPTIPPSKNASIEALTLAEEIMRHVENADLPLTNIALKCSRLAMLLNEQDYEQLFKWEVTGYPQPPEPQAPVMDEVWRLATLAKRQFQYTDPNTKKTEPRVYMESIEAFERQIDSAKARMTAAHDVPNSKPFSFGNAFERQAIQQAIQLSSSRLAARRELFHDYSTSRYYQLKYSGIATDVFSRTRATVDELIVRAVPDAVKKFESAYENLKSTNPEDWANAVHSCRRILQDLADAIFPASQPRTVGSKVIQLGADNYINRLIAYVEDHSSSERFKDLVGSHLEFLGNRLDAIFQATQKGSHRSVSKEDADRFVIYTYLVIGDILSLQP